MKGKRQVHSPAGRAPRRASSPQHDRRERDTERPWIFGLHAVRAWLDAQPHRLQLVYVETPASEAVRTIGERARALGIAVQALSGEAITARAVGRRHQGVVAECFSFPYVDPKILLERRPQLLVVVDQLNDPHNLGAIIRSAEAAGAGGLISPKDNCVGVTATVEAASAGASAWLPVCRVTNVARTLAELKECGYWTAGLSAHGAQDVFGFEPPERVALLVGGETGIRPLVARQLDFELRIPMHGHTESLNASVAAALGMFALRRQWQRGESST